MKADSLKYEVQENPVEKESFATLPPIQDLRLALTSWKQSSDPDPVEQIKSSNLDISYCLVVDYTLTVPCRYDPNLEPSGKPLVEGKFAREESGGGSPRAEKQR